jgi:hypothetical protein
VLAILAAAAGLASAAKAATPGLVTDLTWGISNSDQDRTVAAMQDVGARWTRLQIQWKAWETSPGTYAPWEVARTDRAIQLCRAAGIHVDLNVVNAPAWASNTNDSDLGNVPRNNADFANFMRYLATRYKGEVDAYELWNEPDIGRFWNTGPNAAAYTALLKAGYVAVKTADPNALVVSAGLSWDYTNFLGKMYDNGAKGSFDVLALHPYPVGSLGNWQSSYRAGRKTELAHGDDKPIWFTEFGFNTSSDTSAWQPGVTLQQQADLVTQAYTLVREDPYVEVAFYYNFRNNWWGHDDQSSMEDQFGLMYTTFAPKPAYYAFKAIGTEAATTPAPPPPSAPPTPPPPPADAPPSVELAAPVAGSAFTSALAFAASAADDHGVSEVRFLFDGNVVATDRDAPYEAVWSVPKKVGYGTHRVSAVAVDSAGQARSSAPVSVMRVKNRLRAVIAQRTRRAAAAAELLGLVLPHRLL